MDSREGLLLGYTSMIMGYTSMITGRIMGFRFVFL